MSMIDAMGVYPSFAVRHCERSEAISSGERMRK
jgi:hypothetical protein